MPTESKYFVSLFGLLGGLLTSSGLYAAVPAFSTQSPWMLGDWNSNRAQLEQQGYQFSLGYTGEMASLIDAKNNDKHKTEYTDQFALGAHFDLEKIMGWEDTEAQITVTHRNGRSLSQTHEALQGHLSSVQEVWGRGQTWRLTDLWIKKQFLDQKLDIKVGRFGEGEDFNSFDCDFQNLTFCGSQVGNWVGDQWYNWPVSQWAMRVKYQVQPELYGQVGVYEYNPENLKRSKGFNLSTDGSKGAIIPVELVWQPRAFLQQLPGEYRLGYYYSTADVEEIENPIKNSHKQGMWAVIQQKLTQPEPESNRGLKGFINLTLHDDATNTIDNMQNIGLVYTGLSLQRPDDQLAIAFGRISVNDKVQTGQHEEYDAELYYGIHATNWLTLRPNIQYIRHVGGYKNGENVWVGGLKLQAAF
ncbi:carbohydrate porin [Acinetobacter radioresistens]|uniref:carbohydrate porin n=1 Tax=Acinetobacter radioresistens TaxID=40216 RepID=UPI000DADF815|nr:carbohydrate porin [Acinetobacter radioresistens]AWV86325.1 carbohydrate porin [Acinetobacter radioresistens]MCX0328344.1 carbohydrate porin [Acinetobacter radioresistens]RJL70123.1 carbohydrate porin [Acinetobacter radioresistens]